MTRQPMRAAKVVRKVVIPAAGAGSRMLPITKSIPKEMLPIGKKPMIQHAVEEAVASQIRQICIVIRKGKELIPDYFSLRQRGRHKRDSGTEELERLVASCEITFVYQEQQLGLGHALLQAKEFVGFEPFVMIVPDQLMHAAVPATLQLLKRWRPGVSVWSSLVKIRKEEVPLFDGARGFEYGESRNRGELVIKRILGEAETRYAYRNLDHEVRGFGRTVYPPEIFEYVGENFINPRTGEVDLLKTFEESTGDIGHFGILLEGEPFDLGTFPGYYRYVPRLWELSN